MGINIEGLSTHTETGITITPALPDGGGTGSLLLAFVMGEGTQQSGATRVTLPGDWTKQTGDLHMTCWSKFAAAPFGSSDHITSIASNDGLSHSWAIQIISFNGVHASNPIVYANAVRKCPQLNDAVCSNVQSLTMDLALPRVVPNAKILAWSTCHKPNTIQPEPWFRRLASGDTEQGTYWLGVQTDADDGIGLPLNWTTVDPNYERGIISAVVLRPA